MSDTPRTDRAWKRAIKNNFLTHDIAYAMCEFAERLERELNALKLPGISTLPKPAVQPKPRRKK